MKLVNEEAEINTHVHLFTSKGTYEIILAGLRGWVAILAPSLQDLG